MAFQHRPQFVCATKRPVWSGKAKDPPKRSHLHPDDKAAGWEVCRLPTFAAEAGGKQ